MKNWEEQGDIRVHTFKYRGVLKTEFYYRHNGQWPAYPFAMIGIDLDKLKVFLRCLSCLHDSRWGEIVIRRPTRADFCRQAAFRLYYREVNNIRKGLGLPEAEAE